MITQDQDIAIADAAARAKITKWVEEKLGARVVSMARVRRWRPIWRVRYEADGKEAGLIVKGMRPFEAIPYSLQHEMACQKVFEESGFPVPHVFGAIDDLNFVMEFVEGEVEPGLVQQADEAENVMAPERWAASLEFMEWLVKLHRLPIAKLAHTEAMLPETPDDIALNLTERYYELIKRHDAVDAVTDFFIRWVRRNVPKHRTRPSIVFGDGAQFMNKGGKIAAIFDFELAHVGDPYNDFAPFRCRHPLQNMGDVPALYRHYEKVSGEPLDWPAISYATVVYSAWGMTSYTTALQEQHVGGDWGEVVMARAFIMRRTLDAMADCMGIDLDCDIELPAPRKTPIEDSGLKKLLLEISLLPLSDAFVGWQRDTLASIPRTLLQQVHYGQWIEQEYMADISKLLGRTFGTLDEADDALKAFVNSAAPEHDEALARLFHRHAYRSCLVIAGEGASKEHVMLAKIEPLLDKNGQPRKEAAAG